MKRWHRQTGYVLIVLLGISLVAFSMLYWAPGDPAELWLENGLGIADPRQLVRIKQELGLGRPLAVQYLHWLGHALMGDLGESFVTGDPVTVVILKRLPYTVGLALSAFGVALVGALILGICGALWSRSWPGHASAGLTTLLGAIPDYLLGMVLILGLGMGLGWFPVMGCESPVSAVLPAVTIGLSAAAGQGRVLRAALLDAMAADHVAFARSKGLPAWRVLLFHVLPNSLVPVVIMWGTCLGHLLGGSLVVESLFAWPGLGQLMVQAVMARDIPLVQGGILVMGLLYLMCNQTADFICRRLDPRSQWRRHE